MNQRDPFPAPELPDIFASLVDCSPDLIAVVDRQYVYRMVNPAYSRSYGKVPGQIVGSTVAQLLGADVFRKNVKPFLDRCLSGQPASHQEWLTFSLLGRRYIDARYYPLRTGGRTDHAVVAIRDITDHQEVAQDGLADSERRYRTMFESVRGLFRDLPDAIFLHEMTDDGLPGRVVEMNEAARERFKCRKGEYLAISPQELCQRDPSDARPSIPPQFAGEMRGTFETVVTCKDGTQAAVEVTIRPFVLGGRKVAVSILRDITERKRAEEALRDSEQRYRTLIEFTSDWEYLLSPEGTYSYVSPSCERLTGYRPEEFLADPGLLESIVDLDERAMVTQHEKEGRHDSGEARHLDFRIVTRAGEERWISHRCQSVYGPDGTWIGWRASNRDITDRKLAEEALRASEKRYRALFDTMSEGFVLFEVICDEQGNPRDLRYLDANPASERLLGMKREEMFSRTILEAFPDAELDWIQGLGRVAITGEPALIEQYNRVYRRWWRVAAFSTGERQVAIVFADVSAERESREAIRESEERFRGVFEEGPLGMAILGPDNHFFRVNPVFSRMMGYSAEEMRNLTVEDITHPQDLEPSRELLRRVWGGKVHAPIQMEKRYIRKNGEAFWGRLTASVLHGSGGEPIESLAMLEDITERKESDELREQYVSFISHDLAAPLSVVIGQASIVRDRLAGKGLDAQAERVDAIIRNGWRMTSMIHDLTETSRARVGPLDNATTANRPGPTGGPRLRAGRLSGGSTATATGALGGRAAGRGRLRAAREGCCQPYHQCPEVLRARYLGRSASGVRTRGGPGVSDRPGGRHPPRGAAPRLRAILPRGSSKEGRGRGTRTIHHPPHR